MSRWSLVLAVLLFSWMRAASAGLEAFDFTGNVEEDRYKELIAEVRCLVCQNQSLADSDAELAHDLRREIYEWELFSTEPFVWPSPTIGDPLGMNDWKSRGGPGDWPSETESGWYLGLDWVDMATMCLPPSD